MAVSWSTTDGKIYMFSGKRPGTDYLCCEFDVCDVRTMNWESWTNSFSREFSPIGPRPPLQNASATFLSIRSWRYLFLLGGHDGTEINSKVIAFNVNTKVWFVSNPGLPARGRKPIGFVPAPPPVGPYIICGWVASPFSNDDSYLVPELYHYKLPPVQEVECLDVKQKLWELELDLQSFVAIGRRLYMFGHDRDETDVNTVYPVCIELDVLVQTYSGDLLRMAGTFCPY
ncbi:hypothetical protein EDD18DRAFT_1103443 [Armillaria luteobubalina]|uniref:Uncharacterized protein n=1 Tax=Armillaria luteobubalina TaxID=153913 RepID=A0AA39Q9X0_9AGAR|nr:hypothetical protein EDD18DRAFT_1103443 [Armillaria luteobubalina]